jgi:hypothetical protein
VNNVGKVLTALTAAAEAATRSPGNTPFEAQGRIDGLRHAEFCDQGPLPHHLTPHRVWAEEARMIGEATLIVSVQRALNLLDAVGADRPLPAKTLARRTGLPLPTAYHLVRTLVHRAP